MSILVIAALGIAVVLIAILALRLHPLVGLLLGSLFLLIATPADIKLSNQLGGKSLAVGKLSAEGHVGLPELVAAGDFMLWNGNSSILEAERVTLTRVSNSQSTRPAASADNLAWYQVDGQANAISKGDQLVPIQHYTDAQSTQWTGIGGRLADGFTKTFRKLGIPVTMAAIVGICLLESGAAAKLVSAIVALFGARSTSGALTFSGFFLGIPVYFDNVFYLLLPLAKAVGLKKPDRFLAAVMAIIVGATMAHSLVPPTPGPLLVAKLMNVSVGMMMLGGLVVGGSAACVGFAYGMVCDRWVKFDPSKLMADRQSESEESTRKSSPPFWLASLPIVLPILALGGSEIIEYFATAMDSPRVASLARSIAAFNDPTLVFIGTAVFSIGLLRFYTDKKTVSSSVAKGIADAGTIVLLTCAGGAFGASLQQLQLATAIGEQFDNLTTPWGMLATAFFLTTIIRAAQGSATVAMVTSATIVAPVLMEVELPFHPIYVALAIGCGSKPLPWMNDSGFWQVSTMTGMTPVQTLKSFSVALTLMGLTGFAVTLLGAWLIPLV